MTQQDLGTYRSYVEVLERDKYFPPDLHTFNYIANLPKLSLSDANTEVNQTSKFQNQVQGHANVI